jgi:hypothetical protein
MKEEIKSGHAEMKSTVSAIQEKMEATIYSIWSELEETIKHRLEDVLSCVNQKTQGLHSELNEIEETRVALQAVKTSLDLQTKSLQATLAETWNDLNEQLGLMLQVEAQTMKAEIKMNQERMETEIVVTRREFQIKARAEHRRGTETGASAAKSPKFDRTAWTIFWRQFETVAEHNCCTHHEKSTKLNTTLQGQAADVLHGVPKAVTYEET